MKMQHENITICACSSRSFIDKDKVAVIAAALKQAGMTVTIEPDLCKKVMQDDPSVEKIASSTILACYPRAVRSLFLIRDLELNRVVDIRNGEADDVLSQFQLSQPAAQTAEQAYIRETVENLPFEGGTDAWYPVIDKERCSECEKCHDFCLFGVYAVEEGRVKVKHPQNCKNNCPACARICPSQAVIFPKYDKSPINGGLENEDQAASIDTKSLYTDALRARLERRKASVSLLKKDNQ